MTAITQQAEELAEKASREVKEANVLMVPVRGHALTVEMLSQVGQECAEAWFRARYRENECEDMSMQYAIQKVLE